jgi:hypothetical protein
MGLFDRSMSVGDESEFAVLAPRTRFIDMVNDSVLPRRKKLASKGHRAGSRFELQSSIVTDGAEGQSEFEPQTNGFALFLKHMLGALTTAAGTGAGLTPHPVGTFLHTATPGDPTGKSFSYESNRPFADGSSAVFLASGGKVKTWNLAMALDAVLTCQFTATYAKWLAGAPLRKVSMNSTTTLTLTSTSGIVVGQKVAGTGIAPLTTVTAVTPTTVTLSVAATATNANAEVRFGLDAQQVSAAALVAGSTNVTVPDTTGYAVGQPVYGTGVPASATIASITSPTVFVVSVAATQTLPTGEIVVGITPTAPAYLAAEPFPYLRTSAAITFNGAAAPKEFCLTSLAINADMGMVDRPTFCGYKEPAAGAKSNVTVDLGYEWSDWEFYRRYYADSIADTIIGITIRLEGTTPIVGTQLPYIEIVMPALQLEGAMPAAGEGVLKQDVKAMVVTPAAGQPITINYLTGSATP